MIRKTKGVTNYNLFVISNDAYVASHLRSEANFLNRSLILAGARVHVCDFRDLIFDGRGKFRPVGFARDILNVSLHEPNTRRIGMGDVLAVRACASWVKVAVAKVSFTFIDLADGFCRVGFHGDDDLLEHGRRLGGRAETGVLSICRRRCDCGHCYSTDRQVKKHDFLPLCSRSQLHGAE